MKVFFLGLPSSGRTSVAKVLSTVKDTGYYLDASSWLKYTFRDIGEKETQLEYQDHYYEFLSERLKVNPNLVLDNINEIFKLYPNKMFMVDGLNSPKDFAALFNYNEDYVVFLNRIDNNEEYKDQDSIAVSVIRDYCYWLSSANLLPKSKWLEFNFRIPGEQSDFIKTLGSKNTVMIVKSLDKVIEVLKEKIYTSG